MPQRRGETDQEWMARIRRERENIMERTRAAVTFCNSGGRGSHATNMNAFLAIFHPELSEDKHLALVMEARRRDQRS